jgi:hypothetical protein
MSLLITEGLGASGGTAGPMTAVSVTPYVGYVDILFNRDIQVPGLLAAIPSSWVISGVPAVTVTNVARVSTNIIRLTTTEALNGVTYTISVPATGILAVNGDPYDGSPTLTFTGDGQAPTILNATPLDGRHLKVSYSEDVQTADALTSSNYTIIPTLAVTNVSANSAREYTLTTGLQVVGQVYTVTVTNVRDIVGNPV